MIIPLLHIHTQLLEHKLISTGRTYGKESDKIRTTKVQIQQSNSARCIVMKENNI